MQPGHHCVGRPPTRQRSKKSPSNIAIGDINCKPHFVSSSALVDRMITRIVLFLSLIFSTGVVAFVPTYKRNYYATLPHPVTHSNETSTESFPDVDDSSISLHVPDAWSNSVPSLETSGQVRTIHSIADFVDFIDGPSDTLVIVKFHANYCKICSRTILKYKKMASKYSLENKGITFANVEVTGNPKLCQIVGVTRFPFIQIYRNGERVASFGTGPAHNFQKIVGDTIDQLLHHTSQEEWEAKRRIYTVEIQQSRDQLKELRSLAVMEDECRQAGVNWLGYNINP